MKTYCLLMLLFTVAACNSDPAQKQYQTFAQQNPKTTVINSIACKTDLQQSYALYLPSGYHPENAYPLIFCFDPHGDGALPLNLLKDEAEKLGIILVGSNTIRNGLSQDILLQLINTTMADVKANIHIDARRIYMVGFSGGARVALSAALQLNSIRGVIACSGSIPASYIPGNIYIAGIGGTYDMNYAEMIEMEKGFSPEAKRHILLTFAGKHSWPPKTTINTAIQWLNIGEMKEKLIPVNNDIIIQFAHSLYNDSLSLLDKYRGCKQIIQTLNELSDITIYQQTLTNIEANPNLLKEITEEIRTDSIEKTQQSKYMDAFNNKPLIWWEKEIKQLNAAPKTAADIKMKTINQRLLAYISLHAYSATSYAKKSANKDALEKYVTIYGLADPQNPDYFYFLAYYYAITGNKEETGKALEKAILFGFKDTRKIINDEAFRAVIGQEELSKIVNKHW